MHPSSLIFLVLIAIWAAFLLQHWVRRREHLATARSVDRFSEAMRVLERRAPLAESDPPAQRPRSYAVSPARPSRPEVAVKRAQFRRPAAPMSPAGAEPDAAVRPTRIFHLLAGVSARRIRGATLLMSLGLMLVIPALAAFSLVPWWSVPVVLGVLVADLVWLRHAAVAQRVAAQAQWRESLSGAARPGARSLAESVAEPEPLFEPLTEPDADPAVETRAAREDRPYELPAEEDPSGWAPVPVPPPTYTLKAKAPEPVAVPAEAAESSASGPWSLEGMVYDCDLDELVERRSATGA